MWLLPMLPSDGCLLSTFTVGSQGVRYEGKGASSPDHRRSVGRWAHPGRSDYRRSRALGYGRRVSPILVVGLVFFFLGGAIFLGVLFGSGGAAKSRQLAVVGQLLRGEHGGSRRTLVCVALLCLGLGMCGSFAGVASMDAGRAERCVERCRAEGYAEGRIGPSVDREPPTRFVACTCTGGRDESLELRADSL